MGKGQSISRRYSPSPPPPMDRHSPLVKIYLAGLENAGKTTLTYQLRRLCSQGDQKFQYWDQEWRNRILAPTLDTRRSYIPIVHENILNGIVELAVQVETQNLSLAPASEIDRENIVRHVGPEKVYLTTHQARVTPDIAQAIRRLWADPAIQRVWLLRYKFTVSDSTHYFINDRLDAVLAEDYVPNENDVLMSHSPTSHKQDYNFYIHGTRFSIRDPSGPSEVFGIEQLPESIQDWLKEAHECEMHHFILFVSALSDYDQRYKGSITRTFLDESIVYFENLISEATVSALQKQNVGFFLFLNKMDVVRGRLRDFDDLPLAAREIPGATDLIKFKLWAQKRFQDVWEVSRLNRMHSPLQISFTTVVNPDDTKGYTLALRDSIISLTSRHR